MRRRTPDRVNYARALRGAGSKGLHTSEIRRMGLSGNPAARVDDLEARGFQIRVITEYLNGRNGCRHILVRDAGDAAAYLTDAQIADRADVGGGVPPAPSVAADVSASTPEPEPTDLLFELPPRGFGDDEDLAA